MVQPQMGMQRYGMGARAASATPTVRKDATRVSPAAAGMAIVEAAFGYEWLLSGLNKVLSSDFGSGLAKQLQSSLQGNPNTWYSALANALVVPHAQIFAVLVEAGEMMVGVGLFAGAVLWASGRMAANWARLLNLGVIVALVGGILMSANYAIMSGDTLPGLNPGNAFNEGISIDSLLTIIGIGLLIVHLVATRRRSVTPAR